METIQMSPETLANHLRAAAAMYSRDAMAVMAAGVYSEGIDRIREQLDRQAEEARTWAQRLEGYTSIQVEDGQILVRS